MHFKLMRPLDHKRINRQCKIYWDKSRLLAKYSECVSIFSSEKDLFFVLIAALQYAVGTI